MPELTPLQTAIADAIEWARAHTLGEPIDSADFAIQRSEPGVTIATHLGAEYAVTVVVDRHGNTRRAIAELDWIHNESDPERPNCPVCEPCSVCEPMPCECEQRVVDVYLPGDEPEDDYTDHDDDGPECESCDEIECVCCLDCGSPECVCQEPRRDMPMPVEVPADA